MSKRRLSAEIIVFVGGPGDVEREKRAVRTVAERINHTDGEADRFHLVVKSWETHARPGAGRPQGVVNRRIGRYDIFVGLMWARLGTPTGKAASGTVEEYERVRRAWKTRKHKPSVMFYFRKVTPKKRAEAERTAAGRAQLAGVEAFKKRVYKDNLTREYSTAPEFERLIREHLVQEARDVLARIRKAERAKKKAAKSDRPEKTQTRKKRKRRPPPDVPVIPAPITDESRARFARQGFNSIRLHFERHKTAFNEKNQHARITVRREGDEALDVEAIVHGEVRNHVRITLRPPQWVGGWSILYETVGVFYHRDGGGPAIQRMEVRVVEAGGALYFEHPHGTFPDRRGRTETPKDVAAYLWDRFVAPIRP